MRQSTDGKKSDSSFFWRESRDCAFFWGSRIFKAREIADFEALRLVRLGIYAVNFFAKFSRPPIDKNKKKI